MAKLIKKTNPLLLSQKVNTTLPLNIEESDFFSDGLNYYTYPAYLNIFYFSIVFFNGLIVTLQNGFIKDSVVGLKFAKNYSLRYFVKKLIKNKTMLLKRENYVSFFDAWSANHYHFHCDLLPRIMLLNDDQINKSVLILPQSNYTNNVIIPLLGQLGIYFKSIRLIPSNTNYIIYSKLYYLTKSHLSGQIHPLLMSKIQNKINEIFTENTLVNKLYYIKRGIKYGRLVLNEEEIINHLKKMYAFEIIDFDDYTILEAIGMMRSAKVIIGMHGAALTNMVYMPKGGYVFEFRFDGKHNNHCYWHLASSLGHQYAAIFGISDDPSKFLEGNGCNLTVPIDCITLSLTKYLPGLSKEPILPLG